MAEVESAVSASQDPPVRVNPFKKFIDQSIVGFPTESTNEASNDPNQAWVQYLDDESGYLYWYNEVTGEARWAEEQPGTVEPEQTGDSQPEPTSQPYEGENVTPLIISSAWEKYYDDDGNPFYYNKETGASEWEIPAGEVFVEGFLPADQEVAPGIDNFDGAWLGDDGGSVDKPEESIAEGSVRVLKSISSFRSIKSARSVGLHSPHKSSGKLIHKASFNSIANLESSLDSSKELKHTFSFSNRDLKQTLSFSAKKPNVDHALKPKSPMKARSKSGFQMLKEGATVLREATDDNGDVWVEYQSADDGPIFYAIKGTTAGQWTKPTAFVSLDIPTSTSSRKVTDMETSMSDASMSEVVDYFATEQLDLLSPPKTTRFAEKDEVYHVASSSGTSSPMHSVGIAEGRVISPENNDAGAQFVSSNTAEALVPVNQETKELSVDDISPAPSIVLSARSTTKEVAVPNPIRPEANQVVPDVASVPAPQSTHARDAVVVETNSNQPSAGVHSAAEAVIPAAPHLSLALPSPSAMSATDSERVAPVEPTPTANPPVVVSTPVVVPTVMESAPKTILAPSDAASHPAESTVVKELLSPVSTSTSTPAPAQAPVSVTVPLPVPTAATPVPATVSSHIQNIQAEAQAELQRLKERMEAARSDFRGGTPSQSPLPSVASPPISIAADAKEVTKPSSAVPAPSTSAKPEMAAVEPVDESTVDWIELYARSHVVQRTGHWIVLQDSDTAGRYFFRNQDTGAFQFKKPEEIGEIREGATPFPLR